MASTMAWPTARPRPWSPTWCRPLRGTAYGTYNATLGLIDFPASLIAGLLWQGIGPAAPFFFGAAMALVASLLMMLWKMPAGRSAPL
jgi:hypothetical protein